MKISTARKITLTAAVLLVVVGLIWNTGSGTLSSFGWQTIAAICPLGIVETFLASKTLIPRALVVLIMVIVGVILLGKVFCAWLCPVPPLRSLFSRKKQVAAEEAQALKPGESYEAGAKACEANFENCEAGAKACEVGAKTCTSCAQKRKKFDSRHVVLGGALLSTAIFGFPVFCLVCPVGLTFATIIAFWRMVGFNEPTFSLLVFPAILIIEIVFLRKWCSKFCPLGAVISLMSIPNKFFKPKVDDTKCLRGKGVPCTVCVETCVEELDPHYVAGMHECTKCGLCLEKCPGQAITIPFLPHKKTNTPSQPELVVTVEGKKDA